MMDDFYMLIFDVSISIWTLSPKYQLFPRPLENTIRGPWVALLTRVTIYTSWAKHLDIQTCRPRSNWIFSSLTNVLVNWKKKNTIFSYSWMKMKIKNHSPKDATCNSLCVKVVPMYFMSLSLLRKELYPLVVIWNKLEFP